MSDNASPAETEQEHQTGSEPKADTDAAAGAPKDDEAAEPADEQPRLRVVFKVASVQRHTMHVTPDGIKEVQTIGLHASGFPVNADAAGGSMQVSIVDPDKARMFENLGDEIAVEFSKA